MHTIEDIAIVDGKYYPAMYVNETFSYDTTDISIRDTRVETYSRDSHVELSIETTRMIQPTSEVFTVHIIGPSMHRKYIDVMMAEAPVYNEPPDLSRPIYEYQMIADSSERRHI